MKIWIVNHYAIPPKYGGLNRHYYFTKHFTCRGHDVKIFTSSKVHNTNINFNENNALYFDKEIDGVNYTYIRSSEYSGNGLKRIFSFLEFPQRAMKTLKKLEKSGQRPDVLYASSPELFSTYATLRYGKKRNIPVVVEIRDLWPESVIEYTRLTRKNPIIMILFRLEKWIYQQADRIVFTMEGGKDYILSKNWGQSQGGTIDTEKVRHVNNGVDLELFEKNSLEYPIEDAQLDSEKFKVVYTGSVRKVNSMGLLVEAAKVLQDRGIDDVVMVIYGDGTEKAELEARSREYGLNNLFFRKRVDKGYIPSILKKSDLNIFIGPNAGIYNYGLSLNKLFDYMAAGKPIMTNITSGHDNLKGYQCGKVVENKSAEALVEGILEFKNMNEEDYQSYCHNAKKAARDFDYKVLAGKMEQIMEEVKGEVHERKITE